MVSDLLGWPLMGLRRNYCLCPPCPCSCLPSPHRHSLQQVLLLCSGTVVMLLLSLFVE